jgi:hypothetical protein
MTQSTSTPAHESAADRLPRRGARTARTALAALGLTGIVAAGSLGLSGTAFAAEPAPTHTAATSFAPLPSWCPFGTRHGKGSGCRGGGINDNQRLNGSLKETGRMYVDAGECAGKAVGKSLLKNRRKPSMGSIALGTIAPGIRCGRSKGY